MTASATPMPVAYGCMVVSRRGRDQCDAWGRVMRGGVCRRVKMWNFSEAHAAGRSQANVCGGHHGAEGGVAATQGVLATTALAPDTRSAAAQLGQPRPSYLLGPCATCDATALLLLACCSAEAARDSPFFELALPTRVGRAARDEDVERPAAAGGRAAGKSQALRIDPEACALRRNAIQVQIQQNPCELMFSFLARSHKDANTTRVDALQDAAHRDTSRQRRAIASRGSRTQRQPPSKKIEPGQPSLA